MRYLLAELELAQPTPSLELPQGVSGAGILVRSRDRPIAFFMAELPSGVINPDQLRELVEENAGLEVTADMVRQELAPPPAGEGFPLVTVAICTHDHPDLVERAIH